MVSFKLLSTSLLFASALAIPTTTPAKRGFDTTSASLDIQLCLYDDRLPAVHWGILIPNDPSLDWACGRGFLDNFRGRCGVVTSWTCTFVGASGTTAFLDFWTSQGCTAWDGTQAIHAASQGADYNIPCHNNEVGVDPDISNLVMGSGGVGK